MQADANMMPGPKTRSHEDLEEGSNDMSVRKLIAIQRSLSFALEFVEVAVCDEHLPSHHGFLEGIQPGQIWRLVNGWKQHLIQPCQCTPQSHSSELLDAPLNWSPLYLNNTLNVVKLP